MKTITTFSFILITHFIIANPWVPKKGKGYMHLSYTSINYNQGINATIYKTVSDKTLQHYFEIGLGKELGITLITPMKFLSTTGPEGLDTSISPQFTHIKNGSTNGVGNIQAELKKSFPLPNGAQWAASLLISTPAQGIKTNQQLYTGYDAWGIRPTLSIGKSNKTDYCTALIGYRFLNQNYSDLLEVYLEAATNISEGKIPVYIGGALNIVTPNAEHKTSGKFSEQTLLYTNGAGYVSPGLKVIIQSPSGLEITASGFGALSARYAAAAATASIGIGYKW